MAQQSERPMFGAQHPGAEVGVLELTLSISAWGPWAWQPLQH